MSYDEAKKELSPTPFDDVFKTECEKLKPFLVTLIKEIFNLECTIEENPFSVSEANERYLIDGNGLIRVSKRFTDSCLRIGNKLYHVECESKDDDSILFRLSEYNMRIAIDNADLVKGSDTIVIRIPESGLLKLNDTNKKSKISHATIEYIYREQRIKMIVPVMNVQEYSADEIFKKKLFFLIPFYFIRYKEQLREISESDSEECDRIYLELKEYFDRVIAECDDGEITEDETRKLAELSRVILSHITLGLNSDIRERMVNAVGGQVLELQEDRWIKEGMEKGVEKGKITARYEDGMPIDTIAQRTNVSIEVVKSVLKDAGMLED